MPTVPFHSLHNVGSILPRHGTVVPSLPLPSSLGSYLASLSACCLPSLVAWSARQSCNNNTMGILSNPLLSSTPSHHYFTHQPTTSLLPTPFSLAYPYTNKIPLSPTRSHSKPTHRNPIYPQPICPTLSTFHSLTHPMSLFKQADFPSIPSHYYPSPSIIPLPSPRPSSIPQPRHYKSTPLLVPPFLPTAPRSDLP